MSGCFLTGNPFAKKEPARVEVDGGLLQNSIQLPKITIDPSARSIAVHTNLNQDEGMHKNLLANRNRI